MAPLVRAARECGWSIVSGGALGIDGDAHRAALAHDVPQLAVLPCGPDRPYPPAHVDLFERIAKQPRSGILFAQPRGRLPTRGMFVSRNRVIVEHADAVVVVQAELRSGSITTGRLALRKNRLVAAVTGSPGTAALIGQGARPLPWWPDPQESRLVAATTAALQAFMWGPDAPLAQAQLWPPHLSWLRPHFGDAGRRGLCLADLPDPRRAALALAQAEAEGLITETSPGRYIALT